MSDPSTVHILRVFTDVDGRHGNALGVVLDTAGMPDDRCQEIARDLAFSETVFVDDPARGACRIFTPAVQLPFAGHPMVGTAWLLAHEGGGPDNLRPPAGAVRDGHDGDDWWVRAQVAWCPAWGLRQLASAAEVLAAAAPTDHAHDLVWAWADRAEGAVRARVFAADLGVVEDEATGSAAIPLAAHLGRRIVITQGVGSRLVAEPTGDGSARVAGRVVLDGQRVL
jgi:predicted PhzF superfamily epimerase YddE/YHI9